MHKYRGKEKVQPQFREVRDGPVIHSGKCIIQCKDHEHKQAKKRISNSKEVSRVKITTTKNKKSNESENQKRAETQFSKWA